VARTHVASTIAEETTTLPRRSIAYTAHHPIKACVGYWELMNPNGPAAGPVSTSV
jgi:hypothetical protein